MEQKRTLWIIAAVGVFLLVVLGAALILYSPASQPSRTIASHDSRNGTISSNGWISLAPTASAPALPSTIAPLPDDSNKNSESEGDSIVVGQAASDAAAPNVAVVDEMTVITKNAAMYDMSARPKPYGEIPSSATIDLNIGISGATSASVSASADSAQVKEAQPSAAPSPQRAEVAKAAPNPAPVPEKQAAPFASIPPSPAALPAPAKKSAQSAPSAAQSAKPAPSAPSTAAKSDALGKTQYWVQVSSLSSRKNADVARAVLDENKISADVFTYTDEKDRLFYRVRVGPYTTKSEAEYWRTKIAKIDTFSGAQSYVTSTVSVQ